MNLYPEYCNNNWNFKNVDAGNVTATIQNLPNKKSTGIDKIPIQLIKSSVV